MLTSLCGTLCIATLIYLSENKHSQAVITGKDCLRVSLSQLKIQNICKNSKTQLRFVGRKMCLKESINHCLQIYFLVQVREPHLNFH